MLSYKEENQRILIIRLSAIGDVVRTLPAFGMIRKRFPNAYITWVVEENAREILDGRTDLDEVVIFPKKFLTQKIKNLLTIPAAISCARLFIRQLREKRFDVVLDFHGLAKSGIIALLSGAPVRYGYARQFSKEMSSLAYNRHVSLPRPKMSRVDRNLVLAAAFCGDMETPVVDIQTRPDDRISAQEILRRETSGAHPRIIIHPGTSPRTIYKRWDAGKFAEAADLILDRTGGQVIVSWGPGEKEIAAETAHAMRHRPVVLERSLTLPVLAEVYRGCDVYIGGDTGTTHISSFVGTPVVAVFGPTDPTENEPYAQTPFRVVLSPVPCAPCRKKDCTKGDCFAGITPQMVADAACALLDEKKGESRS